MPAIWKVRLWSASSGKTEETTDYYKPALKLAKAIAKKRGCSRVVCEKGRHVWEREDQVRIELIKY